MNEHASVLITLGLLFLAGLAADTVGRRTKLPRVTILLGIGIVIGKSGFELVPDSVEALYPILSIVALTMVSFVLGSALTRKNMSRNGRAIFVVSLTVVVATIVGMGAGLWLFGLPLPLALLFGAVATATDPAATQDAVRQSQVKSGFSNSIRGIVAIDDAWGLLAFSLVVVVARSLLGEGVGNEMLHALWEIGGAVALGLGVGLPAAAMTGRLKKGEPQMTEALGIVFLTAGLAVYLGVSYLLAGITAGLVIANFARHQKRAFHEIEYIQWPFLLLFFLLAGASLELGALWQAGAVGGAYIVLRVLSRLAGGWLGGTLAGSPKRERAWYGAALLPQAGVAVGMALVAAQEFPQYGELLLTITVGTTVAFELFGPPLTLLALKQTEKR